MEEESEYDIRFVVVIYFDSVFVNFFFLLFEEVGNKIFKIYYLGG